MSRNIWLDGIMGVVIGDALGMPIQFLSREVVKQNPITGMVGFGTYNKPAGTWSDDSSMTLATLASIREMKGIDCDDIMKRFADWLTAGAYTPAGETFDQGITCVEAINNYIATGDYRSCGRTGEWANGNGALMRIMPVCLYCYLKEQQGEMDAPQAIATIHTVAGLTHNHLRSHIACGIYYFLVKKILDEDGVLMERMQNGMNKAMEFYSADVSNLEELARYGRLRDLVEFARTEERDIRSSGYVVDSLEAAVWTLITTENFEEGLLKAVNLGDDADTVGAIAGGLAGLYYGYESVNEEWKEVVGREVVEGMCEEMD